MKRLVIGILAHVDSGKTTLSEAMLYAEGMVKTLGRVDHGDAFLDTEELERKRGITIFSKQAVLTAGNCRIYLLDTPGHVDFSAEMERTLQVLDYAVLVISGADGIQPHTETLWRLLKKHNIPAFIFTNKMDLVWKKKDVLLDEIKKSLDGRIVDFTQDTHEEQNKFFEDIAVCDEGLMEILLAEGHLKDALISSAVKERKVFPCYFGSALKVEGVEKLLEGLSLYAEETPKKTIFGAKVFKISHDSQGNRLSYMKITGGSLKVKDIISGTGRDGGHWEEKVNQIRIYSGTKFALTEEAVQGTVCAVTGLTETYAGCGIGDEPASEGTVLEPVLSYRVSLPEGVSPYVALSQLKALEEEEPKLYLTWNEDTKEISLQLMGEMQLEVLKSLILQRFNLVVNFDKGNILYKETISAAAYGVGHFEPLRHYAEVHLIMEPAERGSGLSFDTICKEDDLDRNWQNLILSHLEERVHKGVLTGSPITDIKITLAAGKAHKKHTEGGDFRQATYRAVRQGLMGAENILLEPWYNFILKVPQENVGRAMADIQKMSGSCQVSETKEGMSVIKGKAPVWELSDYQTLLSSYTKGKGIISLNLAGYEPCHNEQQVIEAMGYDCERDVENSPDSVFCSSGSGIIVKWNQVYDHMSLPAVYLDKDNEEKETFMAERAQVYRGTLAEDKELMAIFERTYGPVDKRPFKEAKILTQKPAPISQGYVPKNLNPNRFSGKEYLLVDGYNVVHAWKELEELSKTDFGAAREKLIDILCNYRGFMGCELIVVFDAYKVKGGAGSVERVKNIHVVYTKEAETADMYIEKVTHKIAKDHKVRVVTSDRLEQLIISGNGALKISAEGFRQEVEEVERAIRQYLG